MTNYSKKFVTAIATVAVVANAFVPAAFASTTIQISGNGAESENGAVVNNTQTTSVSQSNTANFTNNVSGNATTGNNDANKNTGGAVTVKTGDASVNNTVANSANQNYANVSCNCNQGDTLVKVSGNGADSSNTANLNNVNNVNVGQGNNADFNNHVWGTAQTGNNDANKNTGGNVSVETGDASVNNHVSNWANSNSAKVGGNGLGGNSMSLMIVGNGADSENGILVNDINSATVSQSNNADFDNYVGGKANSGDNDANKNTGGAVSIETGDASVDTSVDNMANFNWADLNCGCTFDGGLTVKVDGNGYDSENTVNGNFISNQVAGQGNNADFNNHVKHLNAATGNNDADKNTGGVYDDPSIETGDASTGADVSNTANLNSLGGNMPTMPSWNMGGVNLSINFNLSQLLAALGL